VISQELGMVFKLQRRLLELLNTSFSLSPVEQVSSNLSPASQSLKRVNHENDDRPHDGAR